MLKSLVHEPVFRQSLQRFQASLAPFLTPSLAEALELDNALEQVTVVQPMICAIQCALADQLHAWGIRPDAIVGHSMGEVAGAYAAGAIGYEDAARIITARSQAVATTSGQGAMLVAELPADGAHHMLDPHTWVAAINGPDQVLLSTSQQNVASVMEFMANLGLFCRQVKVDYASHSPWMDPLLPELRAALAKLTPRKATIPIYSTSANRRIDGTNMGADFWAENLRQPVMFYDQLRALVADGFTHFLEISPHPVLSYSIDKTLAALACEGGTVVPTLKRDGDGAREMMTCLGELYRAGIEPEWSALYPGPKVRLAWPAYPFQRTPYWFSDPVIEATHAHQSSPPNWTDMLADCTASRGHALLTELIGECCCAILGLPRDTPLDPHLGFRQMGMDSLMAVSLRDRLADALRLSLPATLSFDYPNLHALTEHLFQMMAPRSTNAQVEPEQATNTEALMDELLAVLD